MGSFAFHNLVKIQSILFSRHADTNQRTLTYGLKQILQRVKTVKIMQKHGLHATLAIWFALTANSSFGQSPLVPGTGFRITNVGDDFEDPNWGFNHNFPKSSEEIDEQKRFPTGKSTNGRWYEGIKRGQPDYLKVVKTPEGGLAGSSLSLLMRTRNSGIPGNRSYKMEQDDLIVNGHNRMGGPIDVANGPSAVVRVYLPPFDQWENRSGVSFGYRLACDTHTWKVPEEKKKRRGFFGGSTRKEYIRDTYWPGMFIQFRSETDRRFEKDSAFLTIRSDERGRDFKGPEITEPGWWTFGMSCTADGKIHYYVRKGVGNLTHDDYVTSQYPYGYKAERFKTMFFNVCNRNDGTTWSTPWIIDDPTIYLVNGNAGRIRQAKRK